MKKIWLTSLNESQEPVQAFMAKMAPYGLPVDGTFWSNDLLKMAWMDSKDKVADPDTAIWAIMGTREDILKPENGYGLSLLTMTARVKTGRSISIVFLQTDGETVTTDALPTVLKNADIFKIDHPSLAAKLVAKAHKSLPEDLSDYRLDIQGNEHLGQWFEVGPVGEGWKGGMFGVTGKDAEITFQAVGPKGELPKTSTLNYPMQGMKIRVGEKEYTTWALQNDIDEEHSYFIKVVGFPEAILFGSYAQDEAADVYILTLKSA